MKIFYIYNIIRKIKINSKNFNKIFCKKIKIKYLKLKKII